MTDVLSDVDASSDAELISRVRGGEVAAYGELFSRHVNAANRLGRQLARGPDVDDLVSEAFAKVLHVLQGGGGPDVAFRAYLLTAVRRLHVDKIRAGAKLQTSDDMSQFDPGIPFQDTAVAEFDSSAAAKAFASLPERWQLVLWHLEVEGQKPAEIASLLGMSANSVSALAYRAREGLRQAFLTMHLADISAEQCRWVNDHLGAYVRKGLSLRDTGKVDEHLEGCRRCTAMYLELTEVNSNLSAIIGPLLLGSAAAGYLASTGTAGATGLLALVGRVRETIAANAGAATAGVVAAGVVAVATTAFMIATPGEDSTVLGADNAMTSTAPSAPAPASPSALPTSDPGGPDAPGGPGAPGAPGATGGSPAASAGAVAPIGLASPTTSGPDTTTGPEPVPGDNPTGNPTGGPSVGPSTQPSDPSTGGSDDPSNSPGAPSPSPSPNSSGPSPSPTPTPSEPAPSPTSPLPTLPLPVNADLAVSSASIEDGVVLITVDGSPELPPALRVDLSSDPGGITFGLGGDCATSLVDPSTATCLPGAPMVLTPLVRAAVAPDGTATTFTARIPVVIPTDQPVTSLMVSVSVPPGYQDPNDVNDHLTFSYAPAPEAPLVMGPLLEQTRHHVDSGTDTYHLTGAVTGVPKDVAALSFTLTGDATFVAGDGAGAEAAADCTTTDDRRVTCGNVSESFEPHFDLALTQDTPTPVYITVEVPTGFSDPDPDDNTATTTLVPTPEAPLAMGPLEQNSHTIESGVDTYQLTSAVAGIPNDVDALTYTLNGNAVFGDNAGCAVDNADTSRVTCATSTGGEVDFTVLLTADTAQAFTITVEVPAGFTDPDMTDNTTAPFTPRHDVELASLSQRWVSAGRNDVHAVVGGVPAFVKVVQFQLTAPAGVTFAGGADGATGEDDVDCQVATGTLVTCTLPATTPTTGFFADIEMSRPIRSLEEITITVIPVGLDEGDRIANNSRSVTLDWPQFDVP